MGVDGLYRLDLGHNAYLYFSSRPRGDDWLEDELKSYHMIGLEHVISLLTDSEMKYYGLIREGVILSDLGIQFTRFPVPDFSVPEEEGDFLSLGLDLYERAKEGEKILIHCAGGVGRSSLLCSVILHFAGFSAEESLEMLEKSRGHEMPDTEKQRCFIERIPELLKLISLG